MHQRKDMDYGKELTPKQIWAAYRHEQHLQIVDSVTKARVRDGIAPVEESAP